MSKASLRLSAMIVALAIPALAVPPEERVAQQRTVDAGPGTLSAARKYLEGRWSLLSFELFPPGQSPMRVPGAGTLTYDGYGNLAIEIRVGDATADLLEKAGIRTTNGLLSTKGRTVIDMPTRTLTYVLEGQPSFGAPSGPLALNRPRYWAVEGDVLTLVTKGDDGGRLSEGRWKKVP